MRDGLALVLACLRAGPRRRRFSLSPSKTKLLSVRRACPRLPSWHTLLPCGAQRLLPILRRSADHVSSFPPTLRPPKPMLDGRPTSTDGLHGSRAREGGVLAALPTEKAQKTKLMSYHSKATDPLAETHFLASPIERSQNQDPSSTTTQSCPAACGSCCDSSGAGISARLARTCSG